MPLSLLLPSLNISASANWGGINGVIEEQTDLASALAGKSDANHNHDDNYINSVQSYSDGDIPIFNSEGELEDSGFEPSDFSLATHYHDTLYIPKSIGISKGDLIGFSGTGSPVIQTVGTDGKILTSDSNESSGLKWVEQTLSLLPGAVLTDCENTTNEIDILQFTIPADSWADKDLFEFLILYDAWQYSGSAVNATVKTYINSSAGFSNTQSITSSSVKGKKFLACMALRLGNDVLISQNPGNRTYYHWMQSGIIGGSELIDGGYQFGIANGTARGNIITDVDFGADISFKYSFKWATAHANIYFRPLICYSKKWSYPV